MIRLHKSPDLRERYDAWFKNNREDLQAHLDKHLGDVKAKKPNKRKWITDKYKKPLRGFLFPTSNDKCAYCEKDTDLDIEHFHSKLNPGQAFAFDNLLPACGACNNAKPKKGPPEHKGVEMLHPYRIEGFMCAHLQLARSTLTFSGRSPAGEATVFFLREILNLPRKENGRPCRLLRRRKTIKQGYDDAFADLCDFEHPIAYVVRRLERLLTAVTVEREFTAVHATLLLNHPKFEQLMARVESEAPDEHKRLCDLQREKNDYCLHW